MAKQRIGGEKGNERPFGAGVAGVMAKLAAMQRQVNEEMSALTPEQRAKRAKEELRQMPGQSYLFETEDDQ